MVAQLVEHLVVVQKVEGSIPFHQPKRRVAQSGRALALGARGFGGSNPFTPTNIIMKF